jgi:hypothetical protein
MREGVTMTFEENNNLNKVRTVCIGTVLYTRSLNWKRKVITPVKNHATPYPMLLSNDQKC